MNRRDFVKQAAVAGAAIPLFNIQSSAVSANGKIQHASFGSSGQALADLRSLAKSEHFELVAVAEVDDRSLPELLELKPGVRVYKDYRELLQKESGKIESVNVSVPDHMHGVMSMDAMRMGLSVYCQKPLAHNVAEVRAMAKLAAASGVVTQMGTQLASSVYERLTVKLVKDGWIGRIKEVYVFSHKTWGDPEPKLERVDGIPPELDWDLWCGVSEVPDYLEGYYHPDNWRKRLSFGTGTLGDMGCHIYSGMFRALNLSSPVEIKSMGGVPRYGNWAIDEWLEYTFAGNDMTVDETIKVTWMDGSLGVPPAVRSLVDGDIPDQGTVFIGEEGVLLAPHAERPVCYPKQRYADRRLPRLESRDHYLDFIEAVRGGPVQPVADFVNYGAPLTETILLGGIASRFPMQALQWDAEKMRFNNESGANQFVGRANYRKGWAIPELKEI